MYELFIPSPYSSQIRRYAYDRLGLLGPMPRILSLPKKSPTRPPSRQQNGDEVASRVSSIRLPSRSRMSTTSSSSTNYTNWTRLASVPNTACEPLYDVTRLEKYGVLSLFIRQGGAYLDRKVQVWEFEIGEWVREKGKERRNRAAKGERWGRARAGKKD